MCEFRQFLAYHGTNRDFSVFNPFCYFTVSPEQARQYAINQYEASGGTPVVHTVHLTFENAAVLHDDLIEGLAYSDNMCAELTSAGHDGAFNEACTEIVAFQGSSVHVIASMIIALGEPEREADIGPSLEM